MQEGARSGEQTAMRTANIILHGVLNRTGLRLLKSESAKVNYMP